MNPVLSTAYGLSDQQFNKLGPLLRVGSREELVGKFQNDVGGSFGSFATKVVKQFDPKHWLHSTKHLGELKDNIKGKHEITDETKDLARMVKETYKGVDSRQTEVAGHTLSKEDSDDWFSVYKNDANKKIVVGIRGTRDKADIIPDLKIAAGTAKFDKDLNQYKGLKSKYKDYEFEVAGHSLGGSKAMFIGQDQDDKTHAFNPGYSYYLEDNYNLQRDKLNLHVVDGDHVSNQILQEQPKNTTLYQKDSMIDPLKNHTISYFTGKG